MADEDLLSQIPAQRNERNYTDRWGGPAYGGYGEWIGDDSRYIPGTSAADQDVQRYREMGGRRISTPYIDRSESNESRGFQMGSLAGLQAGARGDTADMYALQAGARGETGDMVDLGAASSGNTTDMQLLEGAASGRAPSRAEVLGKQMSDRALRSQVAAAGSIRGGPGATASAYRAANQGAMAQRADMNMGIQAERAREMETARSTYAGASGAARNAYATHAGAARRDYAGAAGAARRDYAMGATGARGQDIALATSQAQLQGQTQAENAQNERFYEDLGSRTRFGDLQAQQANFRGEEAQRNFTRTAQNAEKAADWGKTKDMIGMGAGAAQGGIGAYTSVRRDQREQDYHDRDFSDVRTKQPVAWGSLAPLQWGASPKAGATDRNAKVRDLGDVEDWQEPRDLGDVEDWDIAQGEQKPKGTSWLADYMGDVKDTTGTYSDGIYHSYPEEESPYKDGLTRGYPDPGGSTMSDERTKNKESDPFKPAPSTSSAVEAKQREGRRDPTSFKRDTPSDQKAVKRGYEDKAGRDADELVASMKSSLGRGASVSHNEGEVDDEPAPWLTRYMSDQESGDKRQAMLSDEKAKQKAFYDGMNFTRAQHKQVTGYAPTQYDASSMPDYMKPEPKGRPLVKKSTETATKIDPKARGEKPPPEPMGTTVGSREVDRGRPAPFPTPPPGSMAYEKPMPPGQERMDPPPAVQPEGPYVFSDERTKNEAPVDNAMADAARSMEPSAYSYKPEFAARSGQKPGEINVGPMANNMAEDPVARTAIIKDDETGMLAIDKDKGLKVVMGSLAAMQHQIDSIKKQRGARA